MKTLPFNKLWIAILRAFTIVVDQGAWTGLFAAASPIVRADPEKYKGAYLVPFGKIEQASADARNPQLAKDLWESSEKALDKLK